MGILKGFIAGCRSLHIGWQVWLMVLGGVNMVAPLFFMGRVEAQVTLAVFAGSFMLGLFLVKLQGFTRLLGLMHVLWIPLVIYLIGRTPLYPATEWFGLWLHSVVLLNGISLLIDAVDVTRYFIGWSQGQILVRKP